MSCVMNRPAGPPRVVGALRLSRYTDASTSPEVQTDTVTHAGLSIGGRFVGWARDTDVSALKTTPWERAELRYWLDRPDEWDVMIWQRMDRAVRSMADMADLGRYAKKHGKRLVFASGPGGGMLELDFTSIMSEFMMMFLAFAAQLEGQTILERNQGAAAYLQQIGRWAGGGVPYGFRPDRKVFPDGNEGWWLVADDGEGGTAAIRREMAAMAIEGASFAGIQEHLRATNAITPKNHRARYARPQRDFDPDDKWHVSTVAKMLQSPVMRGHTVKSDGTPVLTATGDPVLQGEALISDVDWFDLQEALKSRQTKASGVPKRKDAHPLLGVIVCGTCGRNMVLHVYVERSGKDAGKRIDQFTCANTHHPVGTDGKKLPGLTVKASPVIKYVEGEFLRTVGRLRLTKTVIRGGVDNRAAIAELEASIATLGRNLATVQGAAAEILVGQLNGMSERLAALQQTPYEPPRQEVVELPGTWADEWAKDDDNQRRRGMLLQAGVKVTVGKVTRWRQPPEDRLTFELGEFGDPVVTALEAVALEEASD
ncbi:recombinase family protein [Streptomyces sp. NPDC051677]|uniref:recombinase family protein n=1 Tax=Streptomyces sp. NPDC051677 TaxID=3365669 RepID=UPI0037D23B2E